MSYTDFEEEKFKCEFDLDQAKEIFYQIRKNKIVFSDRLNEFYETKMYQLYEKVDEDTGNIIGEFTPKKDEKIIRIVPISPTEIKTKSIINKEDIETKYGIVTYNPNKPNKKGND